MARWWRRTSAPAHEEPLDEAVSSTSSPLDEGEPPHADEEDELGVDEAPDPLVPWLARLGIVLSVVILTTIVMFIWYALAAGQAPRTSVERDIGRWEAAVESAPHVGHNWAQLGYAYAEAGRYDDALATVRGAQEVHELTALDVAEADILRMARRYAEALEAYGRAESLARSRHEEALEELESRAVVSNQPNTALAQVLVGRARTHIAREEHEAALADLTEASAIVANSAVIFTLIGEVNDELGNPEEAEAAYREALRFVPDHRQALDGLDRLGVDR